MRLKPQTYALTIVTHGRLPIFRRNTLADLLIATLFRYRDQSKLQLHAFVVMPDHVHTLLTPAPDQTIERCVQLIKGGYSFAARKEFRGEIWQNGYHAHRVIDQNDLLAQTLYIVNNPPRRNLIDHPYIHTSPAYVALLDAAPALD